MTPPNTVPSQLGVPFLNTFGRLVEHVTAESQARASDDPLATFVDASDGARTSFLRRFPQAAQHLVQPRFFRVEFDSVKLGG